MAFFETIEDSMVNIDIQMDKSQNSPAPARERSIFAIGWVRFKSSSPGQADTGEDEMNVLGMMVVHDTEAKHTTNRSGEF